MECPGKNCCCKYVSIPNNKIPAPVTGCDITPTGTNCPVENTKPC